MSDFDVELHRLRQFLAVASQLNITRAAREMHLSQQAVSATIKTLERDLGVALLERQGRAIALTPPGRTLSEGAVPIIEAARALARAVRETGHPAGEGLTIAHTPAITSDEVFELSEPVRAAYPQASVTVRQCFPDEVLALLRDGVADLALRRGASPPEQVASAIVASSTLSVAVSNRHRLADRAQVTLPDLAAEELIVWAPPGSSYYTDYVISVCRHAGFEPRVRVNHIQGTAPTTAVIGNDCYAFVTAEPGVHHRGRTVVLPVDRPPSAPVQALWLQHTVSPLRQALLGSSSVRW